MRNINDELEQESRLRKLAKKEENRLDLFMWIILSMNTIGTGVAIYEHIIKGWLK